jgi:hypothetical protein
MVLYLVKGKSENKKSILMEMGRIHLIKGKDNSLLCALSTTP